MVPKVLGVYETCTSGKLSMGGAERPHSARIYWFAAQDPGGGIACQPLTDSYVPSGFVQRVEPDSFFGEYRLVPEVYESRIRNVVNALRDKLNSLEAPGDLYLLEDEECRLLRGLSAFVVPGPDAELDDAALLSVRTMLDTIRQTEDVVFEYQRVITGAAIELRKQGRFDQAEKYYIRVLECDPGNDHVMFNLARVYYEMNRIDEARTMLCRALESNPDLEIAGRFLRFLNAAGND